MALRLIVIAVAFAACDAKPKPNLWYIEDGPVPGTVFYREGRDFEFEQPQLAFATGTGFSSKVGGITHSNSFGTSFEFGGGQAQGIGAAGADNGNVFAKGAGYANVAPSAPTDYRAIYPYAYSPYDAFYGYRRNSGAYYPELQNGGQGNSIAQAFNSPSGSVANAMHQSGTASAQTIKGLGTVSSAFGNGYSQAVAISRDGQGTAFSTALGRDALGFNTAAASSTQNGDFKSSVAHTIQQGVDGVQHNAASSIDGPGIQQAAATVNNNNNN